MFHKKGLLNFFAKFIGKHQCQSLFLIKLQASCLQLSQERDEVQVFSCKCYEIFNPLMPDGNKKVTHA